MFFLLAITLFLAALPVSATPGVFDPAAVDADAAKTPPPAASAWLGRLNAGEPGAFPLPRSFMATYRVSWGGLEAARIETHCTSPDANGNLQLAVSANTTGLARSLYTLDATHVSVVNRRTLHPIHLEQTEKTSGKHITSSVDFTPQEAVRTGNHSSKKFNDVARHYHYPGLYDMNSALLYLRSLPMKNGDERTLALMTANSPYLVTMKVLGREHVKVKAGEFPAIECAITLEKINKSGELEPRKGFKSAHAWLSDDADRLLVKVDAQVFVGSVGLELEKVDFSGGAAR